MQRISPSLFTPLLMWLILNHCGEDAKCHSDCQCALQGPSYLLGTGQRHKWLMNLVNASCVWNMKIAFWLISSCVRLLKACNQVWHMLKLYPQGKRNYDSESHITSFTHCNIFFFFFNSTFFKPFFSLKVLHFSISVSLSYSLSVLEPRDKWHHIHSSVHDLCVKAAPKFGDDWSMP